MTQCYLGRRLKTPTEEIWKGVSELPYYSVIVFPRYEYDHLDNLLSAYVDPIGIAVIRVCLMTHLKMKSFFSLLELSFCFIRKGFNEYFIIKIKLKHQVCENSENGSDSRITDKYNSPLFPMVKC